MIIGDGQFDSPGICSKYCTYSIIMDLNTSKIIYVKLIQKDMFQDVVRKACETLIENLINRENIEIKLFLSDRHNRYYRYLRYDFTYNKYT